VGLEVRPDLAGDQFTVRLRREDAVPLNPTDVRTQLRVTPQDLNAGSTLVPLTLSATEGAMLVYTATEPLLTVAGAYEARVLVTQRQGGDVKVAFRLDLGADGALAMRPAPFVQAQLTTRPSPAISGTVQIDLRLTDGLGAPVSGATVEVVPVMPARDYTGPPSAALPVADTAGLYRADVQMPLAGGWLVIITVTTPGDPPFTIRTDASFDVLDPQITPSSP
jgi:hypothetical protein